jgi:hypothetical protein
LVAVSSRSQLDRSKPTRRPRSSPVLRSAVNRHARPSHTCIAYST